MKHAAVILLAILIPSSLFAKTRYAEESLFDAWKRFLSAWEHSGDVPGNFLEDELIDLEKEIAAYCASDIYLEEHGDSGDDVSERMKCAESLVKDALLFICDGDENAWRACCASLILCMTDFMKSVFENSRSYFMPFIFLLSAISVLGILVVIIGLEYALRVGEFKRLAEQNERRRLVIRTTTQVEENERGRISRDLHDTVMQDIRTVLLYARKLNGSEHLSTGEQETAGQIIMLSERTMTAARQIVRNLAPPEIGRVDFTSLLSEHCANVEKSGAMKCTFYAESSELYQRLSAGQKLHIFRIVQESITNAVKHSGAEEISVIAREEDGGKLIFIVSDDGRGFDGTESERGAEMLRNDETGTRLGICGMRIRAAMLNAELVIKSNSDIGTQVKLILSMNLNGRQGGGRRIVRISIYEKKFSVCKKTRFRISYQHASHELFFCAGMNLRAPVYTKNPSGTQIPLSSKFIGTRGSRAQMNIGIPLLFRKKYICRTGISSR